MSTQIAKDNPLSPQTQHPESAKTIRTLKDAGVTLRAVLIALVLIVINNHWITVIEVRWYALDGTCLPLFVTPIFILFLIGLGNHAVRSFAPNAALKRGELVVIYSMVVTGAALASHDLLQNLFGTIGHAYYRADEVNRYRELFHRFIPRGLFVSDMAALQGFYKGGVYPWTWQILRFWVAPLAIWGGFVMALAVVMIGMNVILRKQWTEHEKLVFPLVQLPIEMAAEDSMKRLYGSKLMWMGFAVAFLIGLINGLHVLFPSLPYLQGIKQYDLAPSLGSGPWSAMARGGNGFKLATYPFAVGLAFFIPLDLSFSCWFFYILRKLVQVLGEAMGWTGQGRYDFPFYDAQASGAWLALGVIIAMSAWPHVKSVWRQAWKDNSPESLLYRRAFVGIGCGLAAIAVFTRYLGLSPIMALIFFAIYFLLALTITRVRAELGTPHEIFFVNPQGIMVTLLGYNLIGPANLTAIYSMYWFNRCVRSHLMPNQLESFKMAEGTAIKIGSLVGVLLLATFAGIISSYYSNLSVTYEAGAQAKCLGFKWWVGHESFERLRNAMMQKPPPNIEQITYMTVGAAMVVLLKTFRAAFVGWPFHPAGYALAVSYAMDYFWFAFIVSWLVKLVIVRYGGMRLHNRAVPFFLGLILGDFCIGSIWAIVGPLIGTQTYKIFI